MISYEKAHNAYLLGNKYLNKYEYFKAKQCYIIASERPEFKEDSILKLILVDFKMGEYYEARKKLKTNLNINPQKTFQYFGQVENIENNFNESLKYYSKCLSIPEAQSKALLSIAKIYIQLGDYDVARKMLETMQLDPPYFVQATFGLINLNILTGDFKQAHELINKINPVNLTSKLLDHYKSSLSYIRYQLGMLTENDKKTIRNSYLTQRLCSSNDKILIQHIARHNDQSRRYAYGCFFEDTSVKTLLDIAREKIKSINANHFELSDMYRFKLPYPIGYKGDEIVNDLCVVTLTGTKDIATMYPVRLSPEFDKEGYSTSEELKLKRLRGGMRYE